MQLVLFGLILGGCVSGPPVDDQTIAEFRKYAAMKLSGLSEAKLDAIVARVDANSDGIVSDDEFAKRLAVFRDIKKGPEPWRENLKAARAFAKKAGKPLLIYARADWCGPCRAFEKDTLPLEPVQQALSGYVLMQLHIDKDKDTAQELAINAIPAFIIEKPDGESLMERGAKREDGFIAFLAKGREPSVADKVRPKPVELRVLTYNIHHGAGVDGKLDLERIAKVILSAKPDIVALQEVDRNAARTKVVDQAKELSKLTKMKFIFGPNIKLGDGDYGNAVLSRFPLKFRKNHKLPNVDKGEQRGVLDVEVETPGGRVRVLATHFDHRKPGKEREASARFVTELARREPKLLTILAGDLNAVPDSTPLKSLAKNWRRPSGIFLTVPVAKPARQIDYVLAALGSSCDFAGTRVLAESVASDHRALLTVVKIGAQPAVKRTEPASKSSAK